MSAIVLVNGDYGSDASKATITAPKALVLLLLSLSHVPAVIAYPVFSVGTILLVGLAGALIFQERLTRRQSIAIVIIAAAMVLLNT